MSDRPPLRMRLAWIVSLCFRDMDFVSDFLWARAGEKWSCLCGMVCGVGMIIPFQRRGAKKESP